MNLGPETAFGSRASTTNEIEIVSMPEIERYTDRVNDMPAVTGANQQIVGAARGRSSSSVSE
jgi:hypothetical protein